MANIFDNISTFAKTMVPASQNSLVMTKRAVRYANKDLIDASVFKGDSSLFGPDVGDTIKIRRPTNFLVGDGLVAGSTQDIFERSYNLTVNNISHIVVPINALQATQNLYSIKDSFFMPAGKNLANRIDQRTMARANLRFNRAVGGDAPLTFDVTNEMQARLASVGVETNLEAYLSPKAAQTLGTSTFPEFNKRVNTEAADYGYLGYLADIDMYRTQSAIVVETGTHSFGGAGSYYVIDSIDASGVTDANATITISNIDNTDPAAVIKAGEIWNVQDSSGVQLNEEEIRGHSDTGYPFQIVFQEDVIGTAGATQQVQVSAEIVFDPTSPYKNITANPTGGRIVPFVAANTRYTKNFVLNPFALAFATQRFAMPLGNTNPASSYMDDDTGAAINVLVGSMSSLDRAQNIRVDTLTGIEVFPELGGVIITNA